MRPYSQDLRDRILRALERQESPTKIARQFEVSRGWVYQVRSQWLEDGRRSGLRVGGYRRTCLAEVEATLRAWIEEETHLTLAEICARLAEKERIHIKVPALWHQLKKWGLIPRRKPMRS